MTKRLLILLLMLGITTGIIPAVHAMGHTVSSTFTVTAVVPSWASITCIPNPTVIAINLGHPPTPGAPRTVTCRIATNNTSYVITAVDSKGNPLNNTLTLVGSNPSNTLLTDMNDWSLTGGSGASILQCTGFGFGDCAVTVNNADIGADLNFSFNVQADGASLSSAKPDTYTDTLQVTVTYN